MKTAFLKKPPFGLFSAGLIFGLGLALWVTNSCKHDAPAADQMEEICFTGQILPIFSTSCGTAGCHDATTAEKGYVFTDYSGIMKAISPGNAEKSPAYEAMISTNEIMPPDNPLPIDKRTLIRIWIEQGAMETTCPTSTTTAEGKSGTLWAFYDRDIEPILSSSCAVSDCLDAASQKEEINLSSFAKVWTNIKAGHPGSRDIQRKGGKVVPLTFALVQSGPEKGN